MGPKYQAIASFVRRGPACVSLNVGAGLGVSFVVSEALAPQQVAAVSSFVLEGPNSSRLELDEEQIAQVQPDGPQDGTDLYISLDNGMSLTLTRCPVAGGACLTFGDHHADAPCQTDTPCPSSEQHLPRGPYLSGNPLERR